jgi:hypothetical protein
MSKKKSEAKGKRAPKTKKEAKEAKEAKDTKAAKDDKITRSTVTRTLPCKLTEKEKSKMGEDLENNMTKIEAIESAKKTADAGFKEDIGLLEEAQALLRGMIRTGTQDREVKCEQETDYRAGEIRVRRLDTGDVFSKRNMTKEETQLPLDAQKPASKLISLDGGKKDRSELKDVKKPGDKPERKLPVANDVIDVETLAGWKRGKVLPSSGSMLDVDVGEGKTEHAPVEGQTWRWPDEVGDESAPVVESNPDPLKASVGEIDKAKKRSRKNSRPLEDDFVPPPDCAF